MSNYRIEIDGLRALAVIPVIFYHVSDSLVSHGYLIENNLEPTVYKINRSEFFSGLDGDTVNIFNYRDEALIWDNAHLTSRAYCDYGNFLFSKIESHIEMSSLQSNISSIKLLTD